MFNTKTSYCEAYVWKHTEQDATNIEIEEMEWLCLFLLNLTS